MGRLGGLREGGGGRSWGGRESEWHTHVSSCEEGILILGSQGEPNYALEVTAT